MARSEERESAGDVDLAALREEYTRGGLTEADLAPDPVTQFRRWMSEALEAGLHDPNAMVVATVGPEGRPSSRMVLLKGVGEDGFTFYTNLTSRKGVELAQEPECALLFPWHPLERQVRVEGRASLVDRTAVDDYFATRPRGSRIGAWASPQSTVVAGREELARRYDDALERFGGDDEPVPTPEHWGGYVVRPEAVEFWQGRPGRMHDRLVYRRTPSGWRVERLAP